jgi:hypothetical protein
MGLYKIIEKLEAETYFKYMAIGIVTIFFTGLIEINLNIFLALLISAIIIIYLEERRLTEAETLERQHEVKLDTIKPIPKKFSPYYDVVDFFFSIQDFYAYNPPVYEEIIDNVDNFFTLYENIKKDISVPEQYFKLAENKKQNAINALHSMIFKIIEDKKITNKLDRACKKLDKILGKYLDEMYDISKKDIMKKGYDVSRSLINIGPKPVNHFTNNIGDITYDIY